MNTLLKPGFICSALIFLGSCQSPADKALEEFKKIDSSLQQTTKLTDSSIGAFSRHADPRAAAEINKASDDLYFYIDSLKQNLNRFADKLDDDDVLSPVNKFMVDAKNSEKLFTKIEFYQTLCLSMISREEDEQFINDLFAGYRQNKRIQENLFYNIPLEAAQTLLTKFKSDVKAAQLKVLAQYTVAN